MQRTKAVVFFFVTAALFALPAAYLAFTNEKLALHLAMNACHAPWSDAFFRVATHFSDGILPALFALLLLLVRDMRSFLMMALSTGLSSIVVQLLKRQVFADMHRPGKFSEGLEGLHWVDGIDLYMHFSFPSGHATAAFSMCLAWAVIVGRPKWAVVLACAAVVLAYSRVYLSQHFVQDILAGAALGAGIAGLVFFWLYRSRFAVRPWLDRRAFQFPK